MEAVLKYQFFVRYIYGSNKEFPDEVGLKTG